MADDTRYVSYNDTSPTARRIAKIILNGFDAYFADFQNITLGAKARFETANWLAALNAHTRRLDLYKIKVNEITELLQGVTSKDLSNIHLWREARSAYVQLVASHANHEIAESFYNSIFNNFFDHEHIHQRNIFVLPTRSIDEKPVPDYSISISYEAGGDEATLFNKIMDDFEFSIPWEDKKRDVEHIVEVFRREVLTPLGEKPEDISVQMLESVFYRNKAAYIVGRAQCGGKTVPVILACRHTEKGSVYIDTLITDTDNASIIFSFTRSYFMVDASMPSQFVQFLQTLMPNKTLAELYNSLGMNKHGKTEFYRDLVRHMKSSDDLYVVAEGIKGMVMTVFTLPSYDQVFKIIKDKFDYPKTVTESIVKEKYRLVSRSDKAGRMADTQEYTNFIFYRNRFSDELIEELQKTCPSKIIMTDKLIIIKHLYIERRMIPLNIYLQTASDQQIHDVMDEYGNSIKQLASANIFPGDMLLKNFGVTRHNRVVFYDYDEISLITECNFRKIPEPQTEEQEMADKPWYPVEENDVFPEEFRLFFSGIPAARKAFEELHSDLYDYRYWQRLQADIMNGKVTDSFPYRRSKRFRKPSH